MIHLSLNFVSSSLVCFLRNFVFSLNTNSLSLSSSPLSTSYLRSPGHDNGSSMTDRERDISRRVRRG